MFVYIGTLGDAILGARLDTVTGRLTLVGPMAKIENPSWQVIDPRRPILYSVSETGNTGDREGGVYSLSIDPASGALTVLNRVGSGGGGPTHMSYDVRSDTVFVGNFGGGQVAAIPVKNDGTLLPATSVQTDTGLGPSPKQNMPHAHAAVLDPSGRFLLTPDMGADRVFVRRFDARTKTLIPGDPPFEATPPASGPRQLVFSRDGRFVFVLTELTAQVHSYRWDAKTGRLHAVQAVAIDKPDFKGERSAAAIHLSSDGRFLYVSNRGANTLHVFAVDQKSGTVTLRQEIGAGGDTPRGFELDPSGRWMIVAHRRSNTLSVFAVDRTTGRLAPTGPALAVPIPPVSVAFYPLQSKRP